MKIEILMLKENNERGVRMMFLSLEQLQKLKLNPTRADYEIAYETEVKEQEGTALNVSEIMEGLYERLNRPDRPNRKTMRSMSVGDIIQIDGKELFFSVRFCLWHLAVIRLQVSLLHSPVYLVDGVQTF